MRRFEKPVKHREAGTFIAILAALISFITLTVNVYADVPGRVLPGGAVPNPGTQQQELTNITAPAEWNVFEFVVTCGACHGGQVDQHVGHFGNWGGGNMASAQRDPVFRAAQIGANNTVKAVTGEDGAGNVCFRCHSPNGWLSGRFDPTLGGKSDGSTMIQSILLSTDSEGISCEACHRAVGNVTYKRPDVAINKSTGILDTVWNLLAGLFDWQHAGKGPVDQVGTPTITTGNPYGDTTLQFLDGMTYIGKYSGMTDVYFSDLPINGSYTGQIYAVYPDSWVADGNPVNPAPAGFPVTNSAGQTLAYNLDGTLPPLFELPISTPVRGASPVFAAQAFSIEHPTVGGSGRVGTQFPFVNNTATPTNTLQPPLTAGPGGSTSPNEFIRTSEFCGTCHDLTVPVLNHGMPEQRTYSEWKNSSFSRMTSVTDPLNKRTGVAVQRCQDCHMPTLKHEYSDTDKGAYNADPWLVGGFPYGKDRNPQGGTAVHKLTGSNRDLPDMMKVLYPEVDLEVIGAPSGKDPRVFPGMLSDRSPMWDRAKQNTEITLRDGVDIKITQPPTETTTPGVYEMKVKVTNQSGHRIPSGYPDGRRFWLSVQAKDSANALIYESGVYDDLNAELMTTTTAPFNRALTNVIDATTSNAVMVYERVTGMCYSDLAKTKWIYPEPAAGTPVTCVPSPQVINNFILFDNRIPPRGFDAAGARNAGVKFWNYDPATFAPVEELGRFDAAQQAGGYDEVTYRFAAEPGLQNLSASAEVYWQTHTREFMEHLRTDDSSTVRPEGPPNPFDPNYPNVPNYLSNSINGKPLSFYSALDGSPLNDNWGGVAYAAWLATGKGTPFLVDRDDTAVTAAPAAPTLTVRELNASDPEYIDPVTLAPDSFAAKFSWDPVPGADGYTIWVRYGVSEATADWDRLVVKVGNDNTTHLEHLFNPGKTYGFKVVAYNGKGESVSNVVNHTVATFMPVAPTGLTASNAAPGSTASSITLSWTDNANNEAGFEIWRLGPTSVNGTPIVYNGMPPAAIVGGLNAAGGGIGSQTANAATGLNTYIDTDAALLPTACYNYQVRAVTNNVDVSTWALAPSAGCTIAATPVINLTATPVSGTRINLTWNSNATSVAGYQITRVPAFAPTATISMPATSSAYTDTTALPATTFTYTISALSAANAVLATKSVTVITPDVPKAPTALAAVATTTQIKVSWTDNAANEDGFVLERSDNGGVYTQIPGIGAFLAPNTVSYIDTVVLANVEYQYRVKAIHLVNGDSGYAVGTPVSLMSVPAAPGSFIGKLSTNPATLLPTVTLTWLDNAINEANFNIQRRTGDCIGTTGYSTSILVPAVTGKGGAGTVTFANLTAGTSYCYRVQSANALGNSAWVTAPVVVPALPATPAAPVVNGATTTSLKITFTLPSGGVGYQIRRSISGSAAWTVFAQTGGLGTISYTDTGLTSGTTYQYQIKVANIGGWSTNWSTSGSGTTLAPPTAPTALTTANVTATGLTLNWAVVNSATSYTVQIATDAAFTANMVTTPTTINSINVTGLSSGGTYYFRVSATNAVGTSPYSAVKSQQTLVPPPAPAAPTTANVTATGLTLNWVAVTGATSYTVQMATDAAFTANVVSTPTTVNSLNVTGLTSGTIYYFQISATNAAGTSPFSAVKTQQTLVPPPAPAAPTTANVTANSMTLNWVAVAGATSYTVQQATDANFTANLNTIFTQNQNLIINFMALTPNTTYYYRVSATNAAGTSAYSGTMSQATLVVAPGVPTGVTAANGLTPPVDAIRSGGLNWAAVNGATRYDVRYANGVNMGGATTVTNVASGQQLTINGGSATRYMQVRAVNAAGAGAWSTAVAVTLQ